MDPSFSFWSIYPDWAPKPQVDMTRTVEDLLWTWCLLVLQRIPHHNDGVVKSVKQDHLHHPPPSVMYNPIERLKVEEEKLKSSASVNFIVPIQWLYCLFRLWWRPRFHCNFKCRDKIGSDKSPLLNLLYGPVTKLHQLTLHLLSLLAGACQKSAPAKNSYVQPYPHFGVRVNLREKYRSKKDPSPVKICNS